MTDNGMRGRVKGVLAAPSAVDEPLAPMGVPSGSAAQHQALQVLTLAQRTAEEHVASARQEADRIRAEARAAAEQIIRDSKAQADNARQNAERMLSAARAQAAETARNAQANADELSHRAQQRYDDVVGSLAARREALQQQIETLEQFDREYRARLMTFMQNQLRALWVDEPRVDAEEIEQPGSAAPTAPVPAQPSHAGRSSGPGVVAGGPARQQVP